MMDGIERIPQVRHPHDVMAENEQLRAQLATAVSELTAENERLQQALSFARGTLEDIGSSLVPVADRDTLARRARAALVTLDDYWPVESPT